MYEQFEREFAEQLIKYASNKLTKNTLHTHLSLNPNMTGEIVQANPQIPWNYKYLSKKIKSCDHNVSANPNVTWKTVYEIPNERWNYRELSKNPNITWEIVKSNPDKAWNYVNLSINPNITWEIVQANPDKDWNYVNLSCNPNITWEIVEENPDNPWCYGALTANPMPLAKNNYIRKCYQKHFMSCGLAEELISVVWHPRNFEKFKYLEPETFGKDF